MARRHVRAHVRSKKATGAKTRKAKSATHRAVHDTHVAGTGHSTYSVNAPTRY